jgi:hypothetical protein
VKKGIQLLILSTPITLHTNNLSVEQALHMGLEIMEFLVYFRFIFQQINSCKLIKIIHKAYIVLVSTNRFGCRPPNIGENKLKRMTRQTRGSRVW